MDLNEYQKLARRTIPTKLQHDELLANAVLGLCGESGEVADLLKKNLFQGHEFDEEKLIDELGDVLWYIAEAATALGTTLQEIASHNISKLNVRYPNGFESHKSINREEKKEKNKKDICKICSNKPNCTVPLFTKDKITWCTEFKERK